MNHSRNRTLFLSEELQHLLPDISSHYNPRDQDPIPVSRNLQHLFSGSTHTADKMKQLRETEPYSCMQESSAPVSNHHSFTQSNQKQISQLL